MHSCGLPLYVGAGAISLIGLFNIAGSLMSGELTQRWKRRELLVAIYASRGVLMAGFMMVEKTTASVMVFSALMGILWLSTVPPTVALCARNWGTRWLATIFGLVFLGHQIGGFTGAYLGGLVFDATGSYDLMWSIGIAAVLMLYLPLYPSFGANGQLEDVIKALPKELIETLGYDQIATGAGYAQSTFYGLMGFLLLTIAAVLWGSAAIAGAEESGRLELDLAHGIGRMQYAAESALSVLVRLLWLGAFSAALVLALNEPAELGIHPPHIVGAALALTGLAYLSAAAGLLAGALTGRRAWATGVAAAVAVIGYVLQAVAKQSDDLEWLNALSPYAWVYHQPPLRDGVDVGGLLLVWGIAVVLAAASAAALARRDLRG